VVATVTVLIWVGADEYANLSISSLFA
jgi:hypothetical protein